MRIFINKEKKQINLLEILFFAGLIISIIVIAYIFINPKIKVKELRDNMREDSLEKIVSYIEEVVGDEEKRNDLFINITSCSSGTRNIDKAFITKLGKPFDKDVKDPLTPESSDDSGFTICKNFDDTRVELKAPQAEIREIILTKKLVNN